MKTKLSGDVDMLHVWLHEKRQKAGIQDIKHRKRGEKLMLNLDKWANRQIKLKLKDADRPTKRQKLSDQIQHGFDTATKWKQKQRTNEEIFLDEVV